MVIGIFQNYSEKNYSEKSKLSLLQNPPKTGNLSAGSLSSIKSTTITAKSCIAEGRERYYGDMYIQTSLDELKDILIKPKEPTRLSPFWGVDWVQMETEGTGESSFLDARWTEEEWNRHGKFMHTVQNFYGNNLSQEMRQNRLKETEFWDDEVLRDKMLSLIKDNATMVPGDKWNPTSYYITHDDAEKMYSILKDMKTDRELNTLHKNLMKNDSSLSQNAQDYLRILRQNNPGKTITVGTFADDFGEVMKTNDKDRTSITIRKDVLEAMASKPQYDAVWSQILNPGSPIYKDVDLLNVFIARVQKELAVNVSPTQ